MLMFYCLWFLACRSEPLPPPSWEVTSLSDTTVTLSKTKRKTREWRGGLIGTVRKLLEEYVPYLPLQHPCLIVVLS